uniref:Uncharacterized protein n=1 Tax=Arundo donax TaxID=35708 RepID=A0A0A9T660_ARUDO
MDTFSFLNSLHQNFLLPLEMTILHMMFLPTFED